MSPSFQRLISSTVGALSRRRPAERARPPGEARSPEADERDEKLRRLSAAILRILELNHDASSALSAGLIDAELLMKLTGESSGDQVREVASELVVSLFRLKDLIDETRRVGQPLGESVTAATGAAHESPPDN